MFWRRGGLRFLLVFSVLPLANVVAAEKGDQSTAKSVQKLLDTGFSDNANAFQSAEAIWRARRLATSRDARVHYAWGLILRKHRKNREADRQFVTAAARNRPKYLPARQAVVWMKLATGETRTALSQLEALIRDIVAGKGGSDAERLAAARWVGGMLAALKKQKLAKRDAARMESIRKLVLRQFKDKLAAALKAGEADVEANLRKLESADLKRNLIAKQKQADRKKKTQKTLATKKKTAGQQQETLKRSAAQWKEWLEAREKGAKQTLARQMKEFQILERRLQSLLRSMALLSQEWTTKKSQYQQAIQTAGRNQRRRELLINAGTQTLNSLEAEYFKYNQQRVITLASMFAVRKAALLTIQRYQLDVKRYEAATGQLSKRQNALAKWQGDLQRAERRLKSQKPAGALASKVAGGGGYRVGRLVEFDVDKERERLLKSLAAPTSK